jgi:hypothetical protein
MHELAGVRRDARERVTNRSILKQSLSALALPVVFHLCRFADL